MWEKTDEYIRYRIAEPETFNPDTFRTVQLSKSDGIKAVMGKSKGKDAPGDPMKIQSLLFNLDKWDMEKAKKWASEHDYKCKKDYADEEIEKEFCGAVSPEKYAETFSIEKDIFAVGTWNGDKYDEGDLDEMVKNFNELKERVKVPLKIDLFKDNKNIKPAGERHGGMPACGWVTDLKRVGRKLYAHIEKIPKVIKELIDNKAYRNVSSEVAWNYNDTVTGKKMRRVLTGVALLGIEAPAVKTLDDFSRLYDNVKDIENTHNHEYDEKLNEEEQMNAELEKKLADAEAMAKKYADENAVLKAEKDKAERKLAEMSNAQKESEVKLFVDKAIADGKILPAHVEAVKGVMLSIDETRIVKFSDNGKEIEKPVLKMFMDFITSLPKIIITDPKSAEGNPGDEGVKKYAGVDLTGFVEKSTAEAGDVEGQKLDFLTKKYMEANKEADYSKAYSLVKKAYENERNGGK